MSLKLSLAAFLGTVVTLCTGDFRAACTVFTSAKMDPIVAPGTASKHHHDIVGSLAFADTMNIYNMRHSQSSCSVKGDFSNYWAPSTYYVDKATKKVTKLQSEIVAYYNTGRNDPVDIGIARNFPANLSMIAEKAQLECLRGNNPQNFVTLPDSYSCDAIRIQHYFPNCWNGKSYKADGSHMVYAHGYRTVSIGKCPSSHPHKIWALRIEFTATVPQQWRSWSGKAPFTLSSQATETGFDSAHADALLVWDNSVQAKIADACGHIIADQCDVKMKNSALKQYYRSKDARDAAAKQYVLPQKYRGQPTTLTFPM